VIERSLVHLVPLKALILGNVVDVRDCAITLHALLGERMLSTWKNTYNRSSSKKSNASLCG
jgi:hypothetical protein